VFIQDEPKTTQYSYPMYHIDAMVQDIMKGISPECSVKE